MSQVRRFEQKHGNWQGRTCRFVHEGEDIGPHRGFGLRASDRFDACGEPRKALVRHEERPEAAWSFIVHAGEDSMAFRLRAAATLGHKPQDIIIQLDESICEEGV